MDTIFTTASGNFDNKKSFSGIRKHLKHDPKLKHKNSFLNSKKSQELRKYNTHKILINFDDWTEKHFGSFVKEHDKNMKDKKRRFGSVKRFLQVDGNGKARKLQPLQLYTQKLSNEKDYSKLVNQLTAKLQGYSWASGAKKGQKLTASEAKDQALKAIAQGLADCAEGFNERNKNLYMFEYYVHLDEKGSAHFHSDVMPFCQPEGTTKKGRKKKPSWSLNTALAQQYGTSRSKNQNKTNLSTFREQEDRALIESVNKTLESKFGIKKALAFVRLTDKDKTIETGLDHDIYVAKKQKLDDLQKQVNSLEAKHAKALETQKQDQKTIAENAKTLAENQDKLEDIANFKSLMSQAETAKKEKEDAETARDQALQAQKQAEKQAQQANRNLILQLNQQKQSQDAREADLNRREKGYFDSKGKYHEGIESREKRLNDREKDLNARELGGKDSKGVQHEGLAVRKSKLDNREDALDARENDLNNFADDLDKAGSTLEKAVQAFTDGFYQGLSNDDSATTEVENLPYLLAKSVAYPFGMVAGFKRGIKKLLKVVKENKFLKTLSNVTDHLRLENERQQDLQHQQYNKERYKAENKKALKSTDSRTIKYEDSKEKSDDFGPEI